MMEWQFRDAITLSAPFARLHECKGIHQCELEINELGMKVYRCS